MKINYFDFKNQESLKDIFGGEWGIAMEGKSYNSMHHWCSCGHSGKIDRNAVENMTAVCPGCGTASVFYTEDKEFPFTETFRFSGRKIADFDNMLAVAVSAITGEVDSTIGEIEFDFDDEEGLLDSSDTILIILNKKEKTVAGYNFYEGLYDLVCMGYNPESQEAADAVRSLIKEGELEESCLENSFLLSAWDTYLGYEEIFRILSEYIPECSEFHNESLAQVIVHAYGFIKYPSYGDILEHVKNKSMLVKPRIIDDLMNGLIANGMDPNAKTLKESFGFDVGKINPYNADSIQGAIKARKIRNELEESGMYEYLKHVDSPWLSLYEKPNPRQWEKIKNIMKLTGRDLETVIKFIARTPVGVTADLSLLEEITEKSPEIIHWKRGFDYRLQKEYCMTKGGMTPEEIEKLMKKPTMANFIQIMDDKKRQ